LTFMDEARSRVRGRGLRIVYPEGLEERALRAAALLRDQDLARPVLVGSLPAVAASFPPVTTSGWGASSVGVCEGVSAGVAAGASDVGVSAGAASVVSGSASAGFVGVRPSARAIAAATIVLIVGTSG